MSVVNKHFCTFMELTKLNSFPFFSVTIENYFQISDFAFVKLLPAGLARNVLTKRKLNLDQSDESKVTHV